jgi:hypothetical protein
MQHDVHLCGSTKDGTLTTPLRQSGNLGFFPQGIPDFFLRGLLTLLGVPVGQGLQRCGSGLGCGRMALRERSCETPPQTVRGSPTGRLDHRLSGHCAANGGWHVLTEASVSRTFAGCGVSPPLTPRSLYSNVLSRGGS